MNIEVKDIETMVFVATLPRSGSSMTCGILEACGAFGGNTIGEVPANPKGIFENRTLNQMTIRHVLQEIEIRSPKGLLEMHRCGGPRKELFSNFKQDMTYGFYRQGYESGVAYYKNGVYTFFFNRINELFPNAIWLLPNRDDDSVINSHKRLHPNKTTKKIKREIDSYREMYRHILLNAKDRAHLVDTNKIVNGDFEQIKNIVETLGLEWNQEGVNEFVDPDLWGSDKQSTDDKNPDDDNGSPDMAYGR